MVVRLASVYVAVVGWMALAPMFCDAYCYTGTIRLVGGRDKYEGHVEMCFNDLWGTVCDHSWDANDAKVVCRQLGLPKTSVTPYYNAYFGHGDGPLVFDNAQCSGYENRLQQCEAGSLSSCNYTHAAGVRCGACSPSQWHCVNGDCVQSFRRCDGYWDCSDGSDEWNCEDVTSPDGPCSSNQWRCDSGECSTRCDGVKTCPDGGDERSCYSQCSGLECSNGDCVYSTSHCDGTNDCSDASDETGCVNYGLVIGVSICAIVIFIFLCLAAILTAGQRNCRSSPINQRCSQLRHHRQTPVTSTTASNNNRHSLSQFTPILPFEDQHGEGQTAAVGIGYSPSSESPPPYSEVDLFKSNLDEPLPPSFGTDHEPLIHVGDNGGGGGHQIELQYFPTEDHLTDPR